MVNAVELYDHWLLHGKYGMGKSTFASKMAPEYLVVNADGRFQDQLKHARGKCHLINTIDVLEAIDRMRALRKTLIGKIGTVVVDSGTTILDTTIAEGQLRVMAGLAKAHDNNRVKAEMMRALRGAVMSFGCSTLWIFHIEDAKDKNGNDRDRVTIPEYELERMKPNLNAVLTMVQDPKNSMRGIRVEWCRYNNGAAQGQIVWDLDGMWDNIPQRLSIFLREFNPTCGYNGRVYSTDWLRDYLASKGKQFETVEEMRSKLGITEEPLWFNRTAWGIFVQAALGD